MLFLGGKLQAMTWYLPILFRKSSSPQEKLHFHRTITTTNNHITTLHFPYMNEKIIILYYNYFLIHIWENNYSIL